MIAPPDIITEIELTEEEEVIIQDQPIEIIEPLKEPIILLPEIQLETENPIIESPKEIKPDAVDLVILSHSEDIRKLLLLKETIKRFYKKKIVLLTTRICFLFCLYNKAFQIMQIFR